MHTCRLTLRRLAPQCSNMCLVSVNMLQGDESNDGLLTLLCSIFILINNRQNLLILQNQKGIASRPDPIRVGTYNLQSISALWRNRV